MIFVHLLILHEHKVEGTVEECVDEVCEAEVEDEQVSDGPHPPVIWSISALNVIVEIHSLFPEGEIT